MEKACLLPEIIEAILSRLPQRDLLLAQRISRTWREVISRSRVLQQRLFFQTNRPCLQSRETFPVDFNPLLQELFPAFFPDDETLDWENPCIGTSCDSYPTGPDMLRAQAWFKSETRRREVLRSDASWRRMFPSDPAPRLGTMDIWLCCAGDLIAATVASKYRRDDQSMGSRMGLLWDAIIFVMDDNPLGWFSVAWWRNGDRNGVEGEQGQKRSLEWRVKTEHQWECTQCEEVYIPTGLKVVDDEDIVVYDDDDESLMDMEEPPLSVRRRNPARQRVYAPGITE
ncbi:hypothetical protein BDV11DRAFT_171968 [Aspergillus similis]